MLDKTVQADEVIKIAVLAVGGQGGGVITNWIVDVAERNGYYAQSTSVPGVAQRTGATIYYVEMVRDTGSTPILSLMPAPGDVDIVLAAELMEAGRAVQRGFVTPDRTTLITSTGRTLAVFEKIVPGSGIGDPEPILAAANVAARRFLAADLDTAARDNGSVISASLFGALAGSDTLPFPIETYEETIRAGGRGVEASLKAFHAGAASIKAPEAPSARSDDAAGEATIAGPEAQTRIWADLNTRIDTEFPASAREMLRAGLKKVVDFQDVGYGTEYLDRLRELHVVDIETSGAKRDFAFTEQAAKYVANAMAYDDVIRVADLKTRGTRMKRIEREMDVGDDHVMHVTEFMHPGIEEVCGTMPAGMGRFILARPGLTKTLDRFVNKGRRVRTDQVRWFLPLYFVGGLRRIRRRSLRHQIETAHMEEWLELAGETVAKDYALGVAVLRCRRLIKGYSDTHRRGQSKFDKVLSALPTLEGRDDAAEWLNRLIEMALKDEQGDMLDGALKTIETL